MGRSVAPVNDPGRVPGINPSTLAGAALSPCGSRDGAAHYSSQRIILWPGSLSKHARSTLRHGRPAAGPDTTGSGWRQLAAAVPSSTTTRHGKIQPNELCGIAGSPDSLGPLMW